MAAKNPQEVLAAYRELIKRVRHLLKRGSLRDAARSLSLDRSTLQRLAARHEMRRRKPNGLTPEQLETSDRLIRSSQHSLEQLRRLIGVSKSAVVRRRQAILDRDSQAKFLPKRVKVARLCPGCERKTYYDPCIVCQARKDEHS